MDARHRKTANGDGDDLKILTGQFGLQPVQPRHFLAAGGTPRGPEIHDHIFALIFGQRHRRPVQRFQRRDDRDRLRLGVDVQFQHVALTQSGDIRRFGKRGICTKRKGRIKDDRT